MIFLKPFGFIGGGVDTIPPAVASFTVGIQAVDGDVPITVGAITEAGSPDSMTLGWVLTGTDQSAATPAQVKTAAEGGAALTDQLDFGTFAITTAGGTFNETLTAGIDDATSYVQAVVWDAAGNVSTVQADGPVDIDTTAPTLSGIFTTSGDTTGTLNWSTNTGEGTAYWILTTSITPPSIADIIAGTGAVGSNFGSVAVSVPGAQTAITATSLTNTTTYYFHIFHRDAVANDSAISTDDVIPAAVVTTSVDVLHFNARAVAFATSHTITVDASAYDVGDTIIVFFGNEEYGTGCTVGGNDAISRRTSSAGNAGGRISIYSYALTAPGSASTDVTVTFGGNVTKENCAIFGCKGLQFDVAANLYYDSTTGTQSVTPSNATNEIIAFTSGRNNGDDVVYTAGPTKISEVVGTTGDNASYARATDVGTGSYSTTVELTASARFGLGVIAMVPS